MRKYLIAVSLLISSVCFAENKATKGDKSGGKAVGCPETSEGAAGKDANRGTGKRVVNPVCGTASETKGNGGAKK